MRPFYCRVGSKWNISRKIIQLIPDHKTYVEPFVGSGAILFAKEPSEVEVINDKDKKLIQDFKLLKSIKIKEEDIPPKTDFNTEDKINHFYNNAPETPINRLIKAVLIRCFTFNMKGYGKLFLTSEGKNPINKIIKFQEYQKRLKKVKILNQSYETVMKKYDAPDTFFYLDPPYENSTDLYEDGTMDYKKMRELLNKVKGKWLMSLNDSPAIREIFKEYHCKWVSVPKKGGSVSIGSKVRTELLIANYPL